MLLFIVRHGDPIYNPDSLTEKGHAQARALTDRFAVHGLDRVYSSPLIRAQQTAQPTCERLGIEYTIEEWTSEGLAWNDLSVDFGGRRTWVFAQQNTNFKNDDTINVTSGWTDIEAFKNFDLKKGLERIGAASDEFLARQGYRRDGAKYIIERPNDDRVAVFCHQGFGLTWLSHLLMIPPHIFWATFDITHSAVTVLQFANNSNGITSPKCLCLSDMSHILRTELPYQYNNHIDM